MGTLKKVTFTGVDEHTDLDRLAKIQEKYPYAEFGILFSEKYKENGHRYPIPAFLQKLVGLNLNLSAHLCGRLVRDGYNGNWEGLTNIFKADGNDYEQVRNLFSRCQLNVSAYHYKVGLNQETHPFKPNIQFIVQQRSAKDCLAYTISSGRSNVYLLCDPSGGRGKESEWVYYYPNMKTDMVGYAGGIGVDNVEEKLSKIAENTFADFWIDMESKVRDDQDWFDLDAVETVLEKVDRWFKMREEENEKLDDDQRTMRIKFVVECSSPVCVSEGMSLKERVRSYIKMCEDAMDESMRHWGDHDHDIELDAVSVVEFDEEGKDTNVVNFDLSEL